ncbi:MAG: hypothetical protein DCC55_16710 [Chloroflexi bacterium]|nr:MAG: hypothetical protein DCC55_16710 [Chloroflexota bacterium]
MSILLTSCPMPASVIFEIWIYCDRLKIHKGGHVQQLTGAQPHSPAEANPYQLLRIAQYSLQAPTEVKRKDSGHFLSRSGTIDGINR